MAAIREVDASPWKPWRSEEERRSLFRPMTADELADMRAGYPASRYRRRAAVWGRSADRQGDVHEPEAVIREAA